jgi:hypothetical protein
MMAIPNEVDLWCRILEQLSHHHNHHNMVMQYSLSINTVYHQLDTTILSASRNGSFLYLRNSHRGPFQESPFRTVVTSLSATCLNLYRSLAHLTHITSNIINSHYLLLQACLQLLTIPRLSFQTNHQSHRRRHQASHPADLDIVQRIHTIAPPIGQPH